MRRRQRIWRLAAGPPEPATRRQLDSTSRRVPSGAQPLFEARLRG
jgi:hypothetical protein